MVDGPVSYQCEDDIAVLTLDDGKANAVSHSVLDGFNEGLSRAEKEASAVLITGRDGVFSAGFDLKVIRSGGQATRDLVAGGGELARLALRRRWLVLGGSGGCQQHQESGGERQGKRS